MAVFNDNPAVNKQLLAAVDATSLAHETFANLAALFRAIVELTEEHSLPRKLAGIGSELADDYANIVDYQYGELNRLRADTCATASPN